MEVIKKIGFFSVFIIPTWVVVGFYLGGWANLALSFVFAGTPCGVRKSPAHWAEWPGRSGLPSYSSIGLVDRLS
jgi:hypothetical protein